MRRSSAFEKRGREVVIEVLQTGDLSELREPSGSGEVAGDGEHGQS